MKIEEAENIKNIAVDDSFEVEIAQKIFQLKIQARPINADLYIPFEHWIAFTTYLAANFGCELFRIMPDIVYKLLHNSIWSRCSVWLKSVQTPFSWTGRPFRSAAFSALQCLHRIWFKTCWLAPMHYFYSDTNEGLKDCAEEWVLLWLVISSSKINDANSKKISSHCWKVTHH